MEANTTELIKEYKPDYTHAEEFRKQITSYFKFKLFSFLKLPMVFIAGINIKSLTFQQSEITIPYKWLTQNPFKSIYFAAQAMAAELSTGVLALMAIHKASPSMSMLVVNMEVVYSKKANKLTTFTCADGDKIFAAVAKAKATGEGVPVVVESVGRMKDGTEVARFKFTWSFKSKSKKK